MTRFLMLILVLLLSGGCGKEQLESCWRNMDVQIDGDPAEWAECMTYFEDEDMAFGAMNDDDYLYVALTTADRNVQRQVMFSGLTLWFDTENGEKKDFGIRFPFGGQPQDLRETMRSVGDDAGPEEMQRRIDKFIESRAEIEIIGPHGGNVRLMQLSETETIELAIARTNGTFIYELKIPLRRDTDYLYGLGVGPGETLGIGLDSPEVDFEGMRSQMGRGMPGGGGGGWNGGPMGGSGSGGRPGGGEGPPPGVQSIDRSLERPEPFDVWASVRLAVQNVGTSQ